jgi:urease accessory protein
MWLASPALPVGGFAYSEGFEAAVDSGLASGEARAQAWLLDQLALGLARSELPVVAAAHRAWSAGDFNEIVQLNDWVLHTRESAEFRQQTLQTGRSMAEWLRQRMGAQEARWQALAALAPAPTWPLAFALGAVWVGAAEEAALLSFGFGWAENQVQAAVKAVPLGQSAGQRLLQALVDALPAQVRAAVWMPAGQRQCFAPMLAILSAQHEQQYSRLFRS